VPLKIVGSLRAIWEIARHYWDSFWVDSIVGYDCILSGYVRLIFIWHSSILTGLQLGFYTLVLASHLPCHCAQCNGGKLSSVSTYEMPLKVGPYGCIFSLSVVLMWDHWLSLGIAPWSTLLLDVCRVFVRSQTPGGGVVLGFGPDLVFILIFFM
jgi:hypothetical protein